MVTAPSPPNDQVKAPAFDTSRDGASRRPRAAVTTAEGTAGILHSAGLAARGEAVVERDHVAGGAVEWWLLDVGDSRGAWVQHLRDRRLRPDAARVMRARDVLSSVTGGGRIGVHLVAPRLVAPATYAYPVDAGTELFAATLLRGLGIGGMPRPDWRWLPPLCARLGGALRECHERSRGVHPRPALPRANDVTRRVRGLLGADAPPEVAAVRAALGEFPRLRAALAAALRRFRRSPDRVTLHGRYAPGQMLVQSPPERTASPAAYVAGWLDAATGPTAYDAGYFIGELMELAVTAADLRHEEAERGLRTAVSGFYDAYVSGSAARLPGDFAEQVAAFAALKIVEHLARFARYFGDPGPGAARLLHAADALLCPEQGLTRVFAG